MYQLAIVELFNSNLHGENKKMRRKHLLSYKINVNEFMNGEYLRILFQMYKFYNQSMKSKQMRTNKSNQMIKGNQLCHKFKCNDYKAYSNIINNPSYYQLQIVEPIRVGNTLSCIIKTSALSILQRKWRKYYNSQKI